ncbi:FtsB family cell division protein [Solibaculum mannosilyticum]|uniref:FtsB family cell division protein n=1 Tax=Solibaculum mannosilyticum TaxID=2780922 RepID=UPI0034B61811
MKAVKKKRKSILLRIAVFALAVYLVGSLVNLQLQISAKENELDDVNEQNREVTLKNEELSALLNSGEDSEYIERMAREMGYVYPDEQVIVAVNGN